jgi:hypothetical protein
MPSLEFGFLAVSATPGGTGNKKTIEVGNRAQVPSHEFVKSVMPIETSFRVWVRGIAWQIAFAVALTAALAVNNDASFAESVRYLAGISGVFALGQAIIALARQRDIRTRFWEWDNAIALVTISQSAHLIANWIE